MTMQIYMHVRLIDKYEREKDEFKSPVNRSAFSVPYCFDANKEVDHVGLPLQIDDHAGSSIY